MSPFLVVVVLLAAETPGDPSPASPPATTAPASSRSPAAAEDTTSEYRVGAGDALDVAVLENPEISRTAVVQTNGGMSLPLVGEVRVAGLTVAEIQSKLTTLLTNYLVNPQVEVKVREYQSQFVTVIGELNNPGRKALRAQTRLLDILLEAGGFGPRASGDVTISRREGTFADGAKALHLRLGHTPLSAQDQAGLETPMRNGDVITASPKYYVTVEGEVAQPGRYVIEPDLTVTGAISLAGGLTRYGGQKVKVRRTEADGATSILKVDLKEVRNGKEPDVRVQANDVITVARTLF
jgi:polysaccharide export outer membrane protein